VRISGSRRSLLRGTAWTGAARPAEVAARAGVVVTSLPTVRAFADVVRGVDGLHARPAAGSSGNSRRTAPQQQGRTTWPFSSG
jgi:3-hydroxyisobutyrate dehydrogenase-like beta-hydroxyacid dehydrogenase